LREGQSILGVGGFRSFGVLKGGGSIEGGGGNRSKLPYFQVSEEDDVPFLDVYFHETWVGDSEFGRIGVYKLSEFRIPKILQKEPIQKFSKKIRRAQKTETREVKKSKNKIQKFKKNWSTRTSFFSKKLHSRLALIATSAWKIRSPSYPVVSHSGCLLGVGKRIRRRRRQWEIEEDGGEVGMEEDRMRWEEAVKSTGNMEQTRTQKIPE
jgi:hypothetical protein